MTILGHEIGLSITLVSPFATRGLVTDRASLDVPLARDPQDRFILPGTLVTGILRAALERLAEAAPGLVTLAGEMRPLAEDGKLLFGTQSDEDDRAEADAWRVANHPHRALLLLDDLHIDDTGLPPLPADRANYARIEIDRELGAVREGYLQFIELPFAIGSYVTFRGSAFLRRGCIGPDRARILLEKALGLVPAIGSIKASGFGRVESLVVDPPVAVVSQPQPASALALDITYQIDRPFMVGGHMASGNLFVGDPVIPGAAIKGTMATALGNAALAPDMQAFLAELIVGHAFPKPVGHTGEPRRPVPLSLGLARKGDRQWLFDRLLVEPDEPTKVEREPVGIAFPPDMKDGRPVQVYLGQGWDLPAFDVRTRTKINPLTGSAAVEKGAGQLFSHAAVAAHEHSWHGRLIAPSGSDPALLGTILGLLGTGIVGLGKTHARLRMVDTPQPFVAKTVGGTRHALMLATPAALNDVDALRGGRSLHDDYGEYWRGLGYRLIRFFAQQRLEGGYVALRYPPQPSRCEPYLLTEPGSVFLIESDGGGTVPLADLLRDGLPPTAWLGRRDWQSCPFLPQNGFGEIRLDAVDHAALTAGTPLPPRDKAA